MPSKAWEGGSTRSWRRTRHQILVRDGWRCQLKLDGCTGRATCVHHTAGRAATGDNPDYLLASCDHCNQVVGDPSKHDPQPKQSTKW